LRRCARSVAGALDHPVNDEGENVSRQDLFDAIAMLQLLRHDYESLLRLRDRVEKLEKIAIRQVRKPKRKRLAKRAARITRKRTG
jgi:hypothetical protein